MAQHRHQNLRIVARGTFVSAYRITNHLIKFYEDSFLAAYQTQGVPLTKPMSATAFQSMLHAGKIARTGEWELKKDLTSHLGQDFCPTQPSVNMLSESHGIVHYGSCEFTYDGKEKSEFVDWTEKIGQRYHSRIKEAPIK
jgi:hypothetical protein